MHLLNEFCDAAGWLVGEEGRIQVIVKMMNATRLDVTNWAVALSVNQCRRQLGISCNGRHSEQS